MELTHDYFDSLDAVISQSDFSVQLTVVTHCIHLVPHIFSGEHFHHKGPCCFTPFDHQFTYFVRLEQEFHQHFLFIEVAHVIVFPRQQHIFYVVLHIIGTTAGFHLQTFHIWQLHQLSFSHTIQRVAFGLDLVGSVYNPQLFIFVLTPSNSHFSVFTKQVAIGLQVGIVCF